MAWVNGDPAFETAYLLSSLDASGGVVASGWTISNCTSAWNGKLIRIDRAGEKGVQNLFRRALSAHDRDRLPSVAASIQGEFVAFRYDGALGDAALMSGPSIARYRVSGEKVTREAPLALTLAGFVHEWIDLNDAEASRWSELEAERVHPKAAADFKEGLLDWESVARCAGAHAGWQVAVRLQDSGKPHVFRIGGVKATELKMLSVVDRASEPCTPVAGPEMLPTLARELPW
jgi:hypothetical protein